MDRIIFCPEESMLDEAKRLSRLHLAPIQIGESERTLNLDFDKSVPVPVLVPVFHFARVTPDPTFVGALHSVEYINEFIDIPKEASVWMLNHSIGDPNGWYPPPGVRISKHGFSFFHRFLMPETFTVYLKNGEEVLDSFAYSVIEE